MKSIPVTLAGVVLIAFSFTNPMLGDVVVFSSDFNAGIPTEIAGGSVAEGVQGYAGLGPAGNQFGGLFLRNEQVNVDEKSATLSLSDLPSHSGIEIDFLLAIIDSWDGVGGDPGDVFMVSVDGATIFSHVFENSGSGTQSYIPPDGVELARKQDLGFSPNPGDWYLDSAYNMGLDPIFDSIAHTSDTLTIEWSTQNATFSGFDDESWAIDNLTVSLTGVPEPTFTFAIAFGALFVGMRRRRKPDWS